MSSSTIKTIFGFMRSWIVRRLPFAQGRVSLTGIYNYVAIDGLFPTSGQPSESELKMISESGYDTVINLAPTSVLENSVVEEAKILGDLGVNYIHLPVDFKAPTDEDFEQFLTAVNEAGTDRLWVHCAANMRVSAFVYRYRTMVLGHDHSEAQKDLHKIWEPFGVWQGFIKSQS